LANASSKTKQLDKKPWCARSNPINPASSSMKCLVKFTDGVFRNTTLQPDRWGGHPKNLHLGTRWNARPPPLYRLSTRPSRCRSPADPLQRKKRQAIAVTMRSRWPIGLCSEQNATASLTTCIAPRSGSRI
jgi:hypothetical protein